MHCLAWFQISAHVRFLKEKRNYSLKQFHPSCSHGGRLLPYLLILSAAVTSSLLICLLLHLCLYHYFFLIYSWDTRIPVKLLVAYLSRRTNLYARQVITPITVKMLSNPTLMSSNTAGLPNKTNQTRSNIFLNWPGIYKLKSLIYKKKLYCAGM